MPLLSQNPCPDTGICSLMGHLDYTSQADIRNPQCLQAGLATCPLTNQPHCRFAAVWQELELLPD